MAATRVILAILLAALGTSVAYAQKSPLPVRQDTDATRSDDRLHRNDVVWPSQVDLTDPAVLEGSRLPADPAPLYVQPFMRERVQIHGDAPRVVSPRLMPQGEMLSLPPPSTSPSDVAAPSEPAVLEVREKDRSARAAALVAMTVAPVGTEDAYKALADQTLSIPAPGFLMNDIDLDGEPLTATVILDNVDHGTLLAFADGSFSYTPDAGFTGTDSFVYVMRNESLVASEPVVVTIEVVEGNRAPLGTDDTYAALEGMTLSIAAPGFLTNDIDPDGDALVATVILDNVDHGALLAFADGSFSYTPDPGFTGTDSFVYQMRDAEANLAEPVLVTIVVIEGNRPPLGTDDAFAVVQNLPLSVAAPGFLANDLDPDGDDLVATAILANVTNGFLVAFADGSFTYTPNAGFTGTDSFVYRMRDSDFRFGAPVTVTIDVLPDDGVTPVGVDDAYRALADQALSVPAPGFLMNDIDLGGEPLSATAIVENVAHGTLVAFADGSFTYTPEAGFIGTDAFVYRMRNASLSLSEPITVTIDVVEGNRPPVGIDDVYAALEGAPLAIAAPGFLANDIDPDGDALAATAILTNVQHGFLVAFADGSFTYTPEPGFIGTDSFVYQMRDELSNFAGPTTVVINVVEGNRAPLGTDDLFAAVANTTLSIPAAGFLANDIDQDGDALTATAILTNVQHGFLTAFADGSFNYTPEPGFVGTDSFVYSMRDESLRFADPTTVSINVLSKNQPPVADAGDDQTVECTDADGTPVTLDGTASSDPDGDPLTFTWTGPFLEDGGVATGPTPTVTLPLGVHTITLTVDDGNGGTDSDEVEITVVDTAPPVIVVNSAPLVLWPPNGQLHAVNLHDLDIEVHDCDGSLSSSDVVITQVTSDEAPATRGRSHLSDPDIAINTSTCRAVDLRATREGAGNGRVYTLRLEAMDGSGNVGWTTFEVHVPRDQGPGSVAIADEPAATVIADGCVPTFEGAAAFAGDVAGDHGAHPADEPDVDLPGTYALAQNHPNPFNPTTTISYTLPESQAVRLSVFNMLGQEILRLVDGRRDAGSHQVTFDASALPSGMYIYSIAAGAFNESRTMVLLK